MLGQCGPPTQTMNHGFNQLSTSSGMLFPLQQLKDKDRGSQLHIPTSKAFSLTTPAPALSRY